MTYYVVNENIYESVKAEGSAAMIHYLGQKHVWTKEEAIRQAEFEHDNGNIYVVIVEAEIKTKRVTY